MYPSLILKNQFGEQSDNFVLGGSNELSASFVVAPADAGGLGLTGLVASPGISKVFMHTSATPATGNPNPPAGYVLVQFAQAFQSFLQATGTIVAPNSGTPINVTSGLSANGVYVIQTLGTTTAAQWQTLGLPANVVPAVGQAFVAITASAGSGTGTVEAILATGSGLSHIEAVGNPSAGLVTSSLGGSLMLVCLGATSSSVTTLLPLAPTVGSTIRLAIKLIPVPAPLI